MGETKVKKKRKKKTKVVKMVVHGLIDENKTNPKYSEELRYETTQNN